MGEEFLKHDHQQCYDYTWNFLYCTKGEDGFYYKQYCVIIRAPQNDLFAVYAIKQTRFDSYGYIDRSYVDGSAKDYYVSDAVYKGK